MINDRRIVFGIAITALVTLAAILFVLWLTNQDGLLFP